MPGPYAADDSPEEGAHERRSAPIVRIIVAAVVLLIVPMLLIGAMLPHLDGCGGG